MGGTPKDTDRLAELRRRIGEVDAQLLTLLGDRQALARAVAEAKRAAGIPLRDTVQERNLLTRHAERAAELGLSPQFVTGIFHAVISESLRAQRHTLHPVAAPHRVAIQGGEGSYSATAARRFFESSDSELVAGRRFADVARLVRDGVCSHGVLPLENRITGAISPVFDLLRDGDLYIVGELYLPVNHALLAAPGTRLGDLRDVYGHPQALQQCERFLMSNRLELHSCDGAPEAISQAQERPGEAAAILDAAVGPALGLPPVAVDIADAADNETRFIVVAQAPQEVPAGVPAKTTLLAATRQTPGALADLLSVYREAGMNLTRIESRPAPDRPWQALFFIDFEGNSGSLEVQDVLAKLETLAQSVRVIGCYANDRLPVTQIDRAGQAAEEAGEHG